MLEDRSQSFGVARVADQRASVEELGEVGQRVALPKRVRRQPDERTNVRGEAVFIWTIVIDVGLRLRPRAIEQRQEAMGRYRGTG